MRHLDLNTRFDGHDEPLEVDWTILFDCLNGSSGRLDICVFPFYRVEITATVGAENADGGEVLNLPFKDFDVLGLRLRFTLLYLRLNIRSFLCMV